MVDPEPLAAALSVSELTERLRLQLEERIGWVQVRGEISNYKKAPSGHLYFRLKDEEAVLECVAWKTTAVRWGGLSLEDGVEVIAGGKITIYPPRGQYQLVVTAVRPAGAGALQQRFELLKQRLAAEGCSTRTQAAAPRLPMADCGDVRPRGRVRIFSKSSGRPTARWKSPCAPSSSRERKPPGYIGNDPEGQPPEPA